MDSLKLGARLGKYSLVAEIARGGMGIVYLAQQTGRHGFRKFVVVKLLKPDLAEDEKFRQMFLDEARLAARLNHRNIVQTIEVEEDQDRYFFVMEYLEGRTLHAVSRLKGEKALSAPTILRIICDVLAGLHYAHELADYDGKPLGIVHRDLSPRNVFITYDGQVKLIDFGVAKAHGRTQETEAGELKGRVPYMAPEHVSGQPVDRRTDIFSVGVLMREALTNQRVWEDYKEVDILRALLERKIPPLPSDANVSVEARRIIEKAMASNPDDRYKTAHEMRADLERYVGRIDRSGSFMKLGEHISTHFAAQRAHVQALIEQHVSRAETQPPALGGELMLPQLPTSPEMSIGAATPASDSSQRVSSASSPSDPSVPAVANVSVSTDIANIGKDLSIPPPPKPSMARYVVLGLGLVTLFIGLTAAILSTREPAPAVVVPTEPPPATLGTGRPGTATVSAPEPTVVPDRDAVEVTVRASPAIAVLWIDGVLVGQGPHTAKYKRNSQHTVRATADGYVPRVENVTFSSTASMTFVLEREAGTPPAKPSARPKPPPAPTTEGHPAPRGRTVDPEL